MKFLFFLTIFSIWVLKTCFSKTCKNNNLLKNKITGNFGFAMLKDSVKINDNSGLSYCYDFVKGKDSCCSKSEMNKGFTNLNSLYAWIKKRLNEEDKKLDLIRKEFKDKAKDLKAKTLDNTNKIWQMEQGYKLSENYAANFVEDANLLSYIPDKMNDVSRQMDLINKQAIPYYGEKKENLRLIVKILGNSLYKEYVNISEKVRKDESKVICKNMAKEFKKFLDNSGNLNFDQLKTKLEESLKKARAIMFTVFTRPPKFTVYPNCK